jgi:hypothetical protein
MKHYHFNLWASGFCAAVAMCSFINGSTEWGLADLIFSVLNLCIYTARSTGEPIKTA